MTSTSALSSEQTLWLVTLPVDLTGKDVYVSVSMTDGKKNVTIPVKVNGGKILANTVNTITIKNVSKSDNKFAWYEPAETRMLARRLGLRTAEHVYGHRGQQ